VARAAGRTPYTNDIALAEGARQTVEISLAPQQQPVTERAPAPGTPAARHHGPTTLTIGLLTGAGLAIAAGSVTGIAALNHKSHLDKACTPGCPPNMSSELDAFRTDRTLSYLSFGIGLAAAGAGAYFWLHEGSSGSQVGAVMLPGGAAIAGRF
jgi:hypothetical protein